MAAGSHHHSLAVTAEDEVRAWGANYNGQLGDATTSRSTPVAVGWLSDVRSSDAGDGHSLAVNGDGTVWTWSVTGGEPSWTPGDDQDLQGYAGRLEQ